MAAVANVAINVDAANAIRSLRTVDTATKGLDKGFKGAQGAAKGLGTAIQSALGPLLAVSTAVAALKQGFELLGQKQADVANLERGLDGLVGNSKEAAKVLVGIADELGKQTLFNEEDFTQGFKLLTSFRSIATDSYERVALAAADVATVTNQDVNQSLMQLAKALQDPEKGLTALARSGTQFTEQQKEQIKALVQSGDQLGAQNLILKEIESQYGGAAKAAGSSGFAGVMDTLGEVTRDLLRAFAAILETPLQGFLKILGTAVERVAEGWEWLNSVLKSEILPILQPLIDKVAELTGGFDVTKYVDLWQGGLVIAVKLVANALQLVVPVVVKILDVLAAVGRNPVFQALIAPLKAVINGLLGARNEITQFTEAGKGSRDALQSTGQAAGELAPKIETSKEAAARLKEEQQAVTKAIQEATAATDASAAVTNAMADQKIKLESAYLNTQKEINNVLLSQAQRQLDGAVTQRERIAAARQVYNLTVQQAKIEYQANIAAIRAEVQKAQLATQTAAQKFKQVEAAVYLAQAEGKVNEAHFKSLNATREALELSKIQADTTSQVAQQQERGARAALQGKMQAAEAAFQANILSRNTSSAAQGAASFAANMQSGAAAVEAAAQSQGAIGSKFLGRQSTQTLTYTDEELFNLRLGKYADQREREKRTQRIIAERKAGVADKVGGIPPGQTMFEDGSIGKPYRDGITDKGSMIPPGYVMFEDGSIGKPYKDRITDRGSLLGSKKAVTAAGGRTLTSGAGSMPDVKIDIKAGPVTQIEGENYVTTQEMGKAVQAGVQQTLDIIMRDGNVRMQLGLA